MQLHLSEMRTKFHGGPVAPGHCITAQPFPPLPSFTPGTNRLLKGPQQRDCTPQSLAGSGRAH